MLPRNARSSCKLTDPRTQPTGEILQARRFNRSPIESDRPAPIERLAARPKDVHAQRFARRDELEKQLSFRRRQMAMTNKKTLSQRSGNRAEAFDQEVHIAVIAQIGPVS